MAQKQALTFLCHTVMCQNAGGQRKRRGCRGAQCWTDTSFSSMESAVPSTSSALYWAILHSVGTGKMGKLCFWVASGDNLSLLAMSVDLLYRTCVF